LLVNRLPDPLRIFDTLQFLAKITVIYENLLKRRLQMAKTSMDLEENIAGLLCYVVGWITAIVFLILEKENKFVRFHAFQSLLTFLPLSVLAWILGWIPFAGWVIAGLVWILILILWLILMFKAYRGEKYKLPIVGDIAEKQTE